MGDDLEAPLRGETNGSLKGNARSPVFKRIHGLRDQIKEIKRYLYRRIYEGNFTGQRPEKGKTRFIDRVRLWEWLLPTGNFQPSKTEIYYLNSRSNSNMKSGGGTPAIFFPTPKRAMEMFHKQSYDRLKKRIIFKEDFPVQLLTGLIGNSSREQLRKQTPAKPVLKNNIWSVLSNVCPII